MGTLQDELRPLSEELIIWSRMRILTEVVPGTRKVRQFISLSMQITPADCDKGRSARPCCLC